MKNVLIEAFFEGFTGPLRLLFNLITAVAKAVATVHSEFMNQTSRSAEKPPSN
jgi:hypothetical protein